MRVVHLADHMGYGGTVPHGLTKYLLMVLPRLAAAGHEVSAIFLREPHECGTELTRQGVGVQFLSAGRYDPLLPLRLSKAVMALNPDLVHATQVQSIMLARVLKVMGHRWPLVVHLHGLDRIGQPFRFINHRLPQPVTALCVSEAAKGPGETQFGLDPARLRTFYNAFDAAGFAASVKPGDAASLRAELGIPAEAPVVGLAGRFFALKANDRLVAVMPEILRQVPDAHAIFAGDGELRAPCEALATQLGVRERTHFLGHRGDVARITAACDVLTNTSPADNFPYTALEAYALARPVVGYRSGGMPELVNEGVTGFLAAPDDHAGFAAQIVRCLKDPQLRARLGAAGQAFVARFSIEGHVAEMLRLYDEIGRAKKS